MTIIKKPKSKRHYLNNKEFLACIVEYRKKVKEADEAGRRRPIIPDYAGRCLKLICERLAMRPNFHGYSYRDEMVDDSILNCVLAFDNFDPDKCAQPNPFGYFSRIAWRAMVRRIQTEKKETYIKYKNYQRLHLLNDHFDSDDSYDGGSGDGRKGAWENVAANVADKVITNFEDSMANKKKKMAKTES